MHKAILSEVNHLSNSRKRNQARDSESSGERNWKSLNPLRGLQGCISVGPTSKSHIYSRKVLGKPDREGEIPVSEIEMDLLIQYLSTAGHEKPCWKLGRPRSKTKYSLATDSEVVP